MLRVINNGHRPGESRHPSVALKEKLTHAKFQVDISNGVQMARVKKWRSYPFFVKSDF
jgi:hypothetical protein